MSIHPYAKPITRHTPATSVCGFLQRTFAYGQHHDGNKSAEGKKTRLRRQAINHSGPSAAPPIVHEVLRSPGRSLDPAMRAYMEPRFGHDFSQVRVHTSARAAESARAVNSLAYTVGKDIVFAAGQYSPRSQAGKRLLSHELVHVIQQQNNNAYQTGLKVGPAVNSYESEADRIASQAMIGELTNVKVGGAGELQRRMGDGHDLTATRFARNDRLEAVYDDERLIRRGNAGTAIRLIQESLLAQGYTLPRFGADGIFGEETEAAVLQFQIDAGAQKLDGIVGPETMKLLDMHDPGGTTPTGPRSVAPPAAGPPVPPATNAVFSESPQEVFAGYDNSVNPNWLVVPVAGRRQARVTITPANARPAISSVNVGTARVDPTPDGVSITGVADGHTRLEARQGPTLLDTLNVEVKARRNVSVDQHFMRDSAAPPHHTLRPPNQANTQVSRLNRIWERQANVRFRLGTVNSPQVATNLSPTVTWTGAPNDGWNQVTAFATGGNWNVFWVWEYEQDATPAVDDANAGTLGTNTLSEDNDCADGLTLAHEAGHFLSAGALPHTANGIMGACGAPNYDRVRKAEADAVNP